MVEQLELISDRTFRSQFLTPLSKGVEVLNTVYLLMLMGAFNFIKPAAMPPINQWDMSMNGFPTQNASLAPRDCSWLDEVEGT